MKITKEKLKIVLEKTIGKVTFSIFSIFRLQDKVVFSNFNGKKYDDNPRYISEKLHQDDPNVKIVWIEHKGFKINPPSYVKVVQWPALEMFFQLATAKIWVDSHSKPLYVCKRKGQFFVETWHGGLGMKKIEGDAIERLSQSYIETSKHSVSMADVFISNSDWLNAIYRRAFNYKGKIIKCGYPKNDIFFSNKKETIYVKVREKLGLPLKQKILLYAPTFREKYGTDKWLDINLSQLEKYLNKSENTSWTILVKMHPKMLCCKEVYKKILNDNILDVTGYPDMQELIIATDMFITDYSSAIFDFSLLSRPAFIYASDYAIYEESERGLYFELNELPFPITHDMKDLLDAICDFDKTCYRERLKSFFDHVGMYESGCAAETVARLIMEKLKESGK